MTERYRDDDNGNKEEEANCREDKDGPVVLSDHPLRAALPLIPLSPVPSGSPTTTTIPTSTENNTNRTKRIGYILLATICVTGTLGSSIFLLARRPNDAGRDGRFFHNQITNRNYNSNYNNHHGQESNVARQYDASNGNNKNNNRVDVLSDSHLPPGLMELGLYDPAVDFVNEIGISPPYWTLATEKHYNNKNNNKKKTWTTKKDTLRSDATTESTWGPCYPDPSIQHWTTMRDQSDGATVPYEFRHDPNDIKWSGPSSIDGTCRPGFIILGAGKCGTSSLYHYLLGHPRVAPAFSKQIHYFIVRDSFSKEVADMAAG